MSDSSQPNTSVGDALSGAKQPTKRAPLAHVLPSDRLQAEKAIAVLRAFGAAFASNGNRAVTNDEAGAIVDMKGTTVVVTNAFFADLKLLVRQKDTEGFVPSPEVLAFHSAYEWNPDTAKEKLKPVFENAWFTTALLPRLKFRPYEETEALAVLAEVSGAAKEDHEVRLQRLLDFMICVGVISREGTLIKAPAVVQSSQTVAANAPPAAQAPIPQPATSTDQLGLPEAGMEQYTLNLNPKARRKVIIQAPHTITKAELERIRGWLGLQLNVEEANKEEK